MEATTIGLRTEILEKVLANEKLKKLVLGNQSDFQLKYSGLNPQQIVEIEYTRSIYDRMRPQFDLTLKRIENRKNSLQQLEELLTKSKLLYPDIFRITVKSEKVNFVIYLKNFQFPVLKKDERLEIPLLLEHGLRLVLVGSIKVHEHEGKTYISLGNRSVGSGDSLDSLYLTFYHEINEKYVRPLYSEYLKDNSLVTVRDAIFKQFHSVDHSRHRLKTEEGSKILNEVQLSILKYKDYPYFFQEISEEIAFKTKLLTELENISDPKMDIIDRMYLCKEYHLYDFSVVPGNGKRFIAALHGIRLWGEDEEKIMKYLTTAGFGGSILLFEGDRIGVLEHFIIKEKKLGAIIHNTGMWHESYLQEILERSWVDEEEKAFCRSIPYNINGEHGSEFKLTSEDFLGRITNFL
ncbi:MAG: hypothetical protein WCI93_04290 [bacterium]